MSSNLPVSFYSGGDKIEQRLASLASMPAPTLHEAVLLPDRPGSPPGWKPSHRLAAPPPADASLRHADNKSPLYRSKVVVPEASSKASQVPTTERRTVGIGHEARPMNRSPVGDRTRDGLARRPPRADNVPPDRQPVPPRTSRPAGNSTDQGRSITSGAPRESSRQGTSSAV